MAEELAKLKGAKLNKKLSFHTPPPKISAPSPEPKHPAGEASQADASAGLGTDAQSAPPATEGARLARLRRMCEMKPSGRCHVPPDIHKRWKEGTKADREAMVDELEAAGWSKDTECDFCTV